MPIVYTTIQPHEPLEVSEAERLDLERQGLLVKEPATPATAPAAAPAKTHTAAKSKES